MENKHIVSEFDRANLVTETMDNSCTNNHECTTDDAKFSR